MFKRKNTRLSSSYKEDISKILHCDVSDVFLYREGRVGLYAILKSIGIEPDDEVILSAYTCSAVIDTIIALGAKPVYADIRNDTYTLDLCHAKKLITPKTKVIISQNTFGLSYDVREIDLWAKSNHIFHIEDCAHGFGGYYHNMPNGRISDAAFYSTHVSKPFSTGIGGFIVVNNADLFKSIQSLNNSIKRAPISDVILLPVLYYWRNKPVLRHCSAIVWRMRQFVMNYLRAPKDSWCHQPCIIQASTTQIMYGIINIQNLQSINDQRRACAHYYSSFLREHSKIFVPDSVTTDHLFLYYPILVENKQKVLNLAKQYDIEANGLFRIKQNSKALGIDYSTLPVTFFTARHLVNLPTDRQIDKRLEAFLNQILDEIL